jgi:nucleoside-diphosphate-sugar epimerase
MNNESITTLDFIREYEKSWGLPVKLKLINNPIKESSFLSLNSHKANVELGWRPRFTIKKAIDETVNFEKAILQKEAISYLDNLIDKYLKE